MNIEELITESHETAKSKGWWDEYDCPCTFDETKGHVALANCVVCKGTGKVPARTFGDQIALMHSELSEALEEFRAGKPFENIYGYWKDGTIVNDDRVFPKDVKPEGIAVEFADCLIRIFDTCGKYNIPLAEALRLKLAYNKTRPHRHGGKNL